MAPEALISQVAATLSASGRAGAVTQFEALPAGGNNRVYRVRAGERDFAAKHYFHDRAEERDRLGSEYALIEHAWRVGIRTIPRPVAANPQAHLALYEFVAGRRVEPSDIDADRVGAAATFFAALNSEASRTSATALPLAADACLTVAQHVRSVDVRIARLARISTDDAAEREAAAFIAELAGQWSTARERILRASQDAEAMVAERCLSPSDFGFHNVLIRPAGDLCFLDFEYAGWDDPAKMTGDFFLHAGIRPARQHFEPFVQIALAPFRDAAAIVRRVRLLSPVFRTRWACIALNEFLPEVSRRRGFAAGDEHAGRRRRMDQLAKARGLLTETDF
jgi:aminoglycoside phosphotransferase (APT) family kinase protein